MRVLAFLVVILGQRPRPAFHHTPKIYHRQYIANQWRGAGLLEAGFDLPSHLKHVTLRMSGRSLYYRAPDFNTIPISTHSWRVTTQPAVSAVYRF